jgi:hypothetical protein
MGPADRFSKSAVLLRGRKTVKKSAAIDHAAGCVAASSTEQGNIRLIWSIAESSRFWIKATALRAAAPAALAPDVQP